MSVLKTRVNGHLVELEDKKLLESDIHRFVATAQGGGEYQQFSAPDLRRDIARMFTYAVIDAAAPTSTEDLNQFFEDILESTDDAMLEQVTVAGISTFSEEL